MAAASGYVTLTADTWTLISATGAAITEMTMVNPVGNDILIAGRATETAPASDDEGFPLLQGRGLAANLTLAQLFPGVASVGYVYAKSKRKQHEVWRSHA